MTEPKSRRTLANGITLHYWEWESAGPTIVMLHPSSGFGRGWEWVAQELHPDYRILAPDQRGHGDSEAPPTGYAGEDFAADLADLADALGLERFIIAGHSLGGRVGIIYAATQPSRVSHLVLVGGPHFASLCQGQDVEWWLNRAQEVKKAPRRYASAAEAKDALRAARPSFSNAALEHTIKHNMNYHPDGSVEWKYDPALVAEGLTHVPENLLKYVRAIRCSILSLRAEGSWELTAERLPKVQSLLPTARWLTIPATEFALQLEAPKAVAQAIRDFLAETG